MSGGGGGGGSTYKDPLEVTFILPFTIQLLHTGFFCFQIHGRWNGKIKIDYSNLICAAVGASRIIYKSPAGMSERRLALIHRVLQHLVLFICIIARSNAHK